MHSESCLTLQPLGLQPATQWNLEYDTDELLQNENRLTGTENRRAVAKVDFGGLLKNVPRAK